MLAKWARFSYLITCFLWHIHKAFNALKWTLLKFAPNIFKNTWLNVCSWVSLIMNLLIFQVNPALIKCFCYGWTTLRLGVSSHSSHHKEFTSLPWTPWLKTREKMVLVNIGLRCLVIAQFSLRGQRNENLVMLQWMYEEFTGLVQILGECEVSSGVASPKIGGAKCFILVE